MYREEYRIVKMSRVLKVSKSGYYKWRKRKDNNPEELAMKDFIISIFEEHKGRYGYRRITAEIRRRGIKVNSKRVIRILRAMNLKAKRSKSYKKTTNSNHCKKVSENILQQNFSTNEINKVWLSDITYIKTTEGWLYLAVIMDLYSKRILGWELGERLVKELVIAALEKAVQKYDTKNHTIFHSDRGVQFASEEFREMLEKYNFEQSMSGKGNCYDNAPMESFFNTLKVELLKQEATESKYMTRIKIFQYIEIYYNKRRLHSSLNYRTPEEVYLV